MSDTNDDDKNGKIFKFKRHKEEGGLSGDLGGEPEQKNGGKPSKSEDKSKADSFNLKRLWKFINSGLVVVIITTIIKGGIILHDLEAGMENVAQKSDIDNINIRIDSLGDEVKGLSDDLDRIDDSVDNLRWNVGIIEGKSQNVQNAQNAYKAEPVFAQKLLSMSRGDDIKTTQTKMWDDGDTIATDKNQRENFTAEGLKGQKLLLSYAKDKQEVFFYGQYSENNRWDGNCVLNVYMDNKLQIITEAVYDDGELLEYQQAYPFVTKSGAEVWCISKRKCEEIGNIGDSWNYIKEKDIIKEFDLENVQPQDILTVGKIRENIETIVEGFYHGITSDGAYNDDTGEAYLVKFSRDGTVRTLYKGIFVGGDFSDNTEEPESWMIGRKEEEVDSRYAYFTGNFEKGETKEGHWQYGLEYEQIRYYIDPYFFKCRLKWYGFEEEHFL